MKSTETGIQERSKPEEIQEMFNAIAPTYDLLNHVLSFGLDFKWRREAVKLLEEKQGGTFLDIAAGSGDVSFDLLRLTPRLIVGADFAFNMLNVFGKKLRADGRHAPIALVSCDALALPFGESTFDGTIVAFGIRNFADRLRALSEMHRVLKPSGISIMLELSHPSVPVVSQIYKFYSRWALPFLGRMISGSHSAYTYLPASIAKFPDARNFLSLMVRAGFAAPQAISLTFGAATIYVGRKSATRE